VKEIGEGPRVGAQPLRLVRLLGLFALRSASRRFRSSGNPASRRLTPSAEVYILCHNLNQGGLWPPCANVQPPTIPHQDAFIGALGKSKRFSDSSEVLSEPV
jgi:hypothetical protein